MKTKPIVTLNSSGMTFANKAWAMPNIYSLSVLSNASGTASSVANIGYENYNTNLYVTPAQGYRFSGWNVTGGNITNNIFTFGNTDATVEPVFEEQNIIDEMDFIYQANDFDGTKITNKVPNSTFGDYLASGTLTKNGTGSGCYLSNGNSKSRFLYKYLSNEDFVHIQAVNNMYTFYIRMMNENGTGGIMSTRAYQVTPGDTYNYMIRSNGYQIQIHTNGGTNCPTTNFDLRVDRVYKVYISGTSFNAKNLDNDAVYSFTYDGNRSMSNFMSTFWAGFGNEASLSRFYSFAGIARETTNEEDQIIKDLLMNQSA